MTVRVEGDNRKAAMDQLHADVFERCMAPFWAMQPGSIEDLDSQVKDKKKAIPYVWKFKSAIEPLLHRSAELITMESSERRSLILIVIDGGYLAVSYAVMGAILGVWP